MAPMAKSLPLKRDFRSAAALAAGKAAAVLAVGSGAGWTAGDSPVGLAAASGVAKRLISPQAGQVSVPPTAVESISRGCPQRTQGCFIDL